MNYEQFLEQMKEDLTARFAKDLPPELADVRIGIRDVEKLHSDISVTMNTYMHLGFDDARDEMIRLEERLRDKMD